ncbi:hypothetical protein Q9966_007746 [Columba livia]|nr:hypothetical protein Q9966_007746 [Columba livia]
MPRSDWLVASPERTFRTPRHNILLHCSKMATVIHNPLKANFAVSSVPLDPQPDVVSHRVERKVEMAGVIAQIVHYPVNSEERTVGFCGQIQLSLLKLSRLVEVCVTGFVMLWCYTMQEDQVTVYGMNFLVMSQIHDHSQVGQENPFDNSDYVFPENVNELCKLPGETSMGSMPSS